MDSKQGQSTDEVQGLGLLNEHDVAPEISHLLDYGQHNDEDEQDYLPTTGDVRVVRLSVIQTFFLTCLIAMVALAATYFALHYSAPPTQGVVPTININTNQSSNEVSEINPGFDTQRMKTTPEEAGLVAAVISDPEQDQTTLLPTTPVRQPSGISPLHGSCAISEILESPAGKLINWYYEDEKYTFEGPIARAFETTYILRAARSNSHPYERAVAFTNDGNVKWEIQAEKFKSINTLGGNSLYTFVGMEKRLQAYDGWGKLVWEKELPTESVGEIYSDSRSLIYLQGKNGTFYCFGPHGDLFWTYDTGSSFFNYKIKPVIGKRIILATQDGDLHCLDRKGNTVWRKELQVCSTPIQGKDGSIFVGSNNNGQLYKLDADGEIIWQARSPGACLNHFSGSFIALDDGGVIVMNSYPNCVRYDAEGNGRLLFNHIGCYIPIYRLDEKRFACPDGLGGISVYNIEGEYQYTFPVHVSEQYGYKIDPAGNLYTISGRNQIVSIRPLP